MKCCSGSRFRWILSNFILLFFLFVALSSKFIYELFFSCVRYECLPQTDSERITRDNETNTDVLTSLYQLKHGVSMMIFKNFNKITYLFYNSRLDVSHITNAICRYLYEIQKLLRLSIAVCIHAIQFTYTSTKVCYWRKPLISLETFRGLGN